MSVQGSPTRSRELRIPYPEDRETHPCFSTLGERIPITPAGFGLRNDARSGERAPEPRKKSRWSLSKILLAYCPEFAESYAN